MSIKSIALSLISICSSCFGPPQWEQDRPYRSGTLVHYPDGTLKKGQLREAASIEGHPARNHSWVHFHPSGNLDGIQLAEAHTIAGRTIPWKSTVWFDERGAMVTVWLARDVVYDDVPCNGGSMKVATGFYPDGGLRYAFLSRNETVQGLPCKASVFAIVKFHPNGQLSSAKLSRACSYRGIPLKRGARVHLDDEGNIDTDRYRASTESHG